MARAVSPLVQGKDVSKVFQNISSPVNKKVDYAIDLDTI